MRGSFVIPCLFFIFCVYRPTQSEITCTIPRGEHVVSRSFFAWYSSLGRRKTYQCEPGYQATAESAVCTENGWSPKPLCTELKCTVPTIENAERLEKVGSRLEYQCNPGYEPKQFVITCNQQGDWDQMSHCTAKTLDCGLPPLISDAVQEFKDQYKDGETATYECPAYYIKAGDPYLTCRQGRWIGKGQCLRPCTVDVHDMDPRNIELLFGGRRKIYAKHRDPIQFKCQEGYERKGEVAFRQLCLNGRIELPLCG